MQMCHLDAFDSSIWRRIRQVETVNIMIVGVGGQGSLLASKLLGHLLVDARAMT